MPERSRSALQPLIILLLSLSTILASASLEESQALLATHRGKATAMVLGLAVVKRIVEAYNGTITFEGEEGDGTTLR